MSRLMGDKDKMLVKGGFVIWHRETKDLGMHDMLITLRLAKEKEEEQLQR